MILINDIKCEYLSNPIGIDTYNPHFSYKIISNENNILQEAYQIKVYDTNDTLVWDSEKVLSRDSINIEYQGNRLQPCKTYHYQITVWINDNKYYGNSSFETGKLHEKWTGKWITLPNITIDKDKSVPPITFKKDFKLNKKITKARIYATASGIYDIYINNELISSRYFAPGFTSYNKNLAYQVYDVTKFLKEGVNTLNCVLAPGWAVGVFGFTTASANFASQMALLLEMKIKYCDGKEQTIKSDKSFVGSRYSFYEYADFYHGEIYNSDLSFDSLLYEDVIEANPFPNAIIKSDYGVGVYEKQTLKPQKMIITPKGEIVYDFGQNFAGIVQINVKGVKGQRITVSHAEILDRDGNFYTRNLRHAKAKYTYICHDSEEYQKYQPRFTYMGFRYCKIEGLECPNIDSVLGIVLSSKLDEVGKFKCSNENINRLQENIMWSERSNFFDIPTDCPQRDERLGWTGDIAVFSRTSTFNMNVKRFFDKWLVDLRADQREDGAIGHIVPYVKCIPETIPTAGWSDAAILVPWASYLAYGDKKVLEDNYECMRKLVECEKKWAKVDSTDNPNSKYIWTKPFHFGDWLAPNETNEMWMSKAKELATAYFANSCNLLCEVARILGKDEDVIKYDKLFKRICKAYKEEFIDKNGEIKNGYQSAYVCPIYFKMFDDEFTRKLARSLAIDIISHDTHLTTGFLGTPYLLFALSDNGYLDVAYKLLLQEDFPSWLYEIKNGATTIWERWDSLKPDGFVQDNDEDINNMVSFNHYAFGAVGDWLYRRVAGIEANHNTPGYKHFIIKPLVGGGLTYVKASHESMYGLIESNWEITNNVFTLRVTIPCNTTATVILPNGCNHLCGSGKYEFNVKIESVN